MNAGATREFVLMKIRICRLGLAKRDLWGLGAESWFVVASYAFAKMITSYWRIILAKA